MNFECGIVESKENAGTEEQRGPCDFHNDHDRNAIHSRSPRRQIAPYDCRPRWATLKPQREEHQINFTHDH